MEDVTQSRVASILTIVAGAWLAISPAFISMTGGALASVIIAGIIMALAGLVQLFWTNTSPSWLAGLVAIYLFVTAFSFSLSNAAMWNQAISAVVAFILATWDGAEVASMREHHPAM